MHGSKSSNALIQAGQQQCIEQSRKGKKEQRSNVRGQERAVQAAMHRQEQSRERAKGNHQKRSEWMGRNRGMPVKVMEGVMSRLSKCSILACMGIDI